MTEVRVPYTTGFSTQSFNTSELLNQGAELTLTAQILKTKDWRLSFSANWAWNRNKLLRYEAPSGGNNLWSSNLVGYPIGAVISGKVTGIDPRLGIYVYEARPDAVFTSAADRGLAENYAYYLGTSVAPHNGGYSLNLSYKNLSLSLGGSFSIGGKVLNNIDCPVSYSTIDGGSVVERIPTQDNDLYVNHLNVSKDAVNRWTPQNPITDGRPRIIDAYGERLGLDNYMVTSSVITRASMLEDVSYFKLGSLLLSYNVTGKWMKRIKLESMNLSFSMNNLFILTNYSGIDPETPGAVYPMARTYSFGLSLGF